MTGSTTPAPVGGDMITPGGPAGEVKVGGGKRTRGASVKALKKMLKKAGLKTTGKKAALTRRAKKAHLKIKGGNTGTVLQNEQPLVTPPPGGRKSRRSRGKLGVFGL